MGGTDVTKVGRRCVVLKETQPNAEMLKVKPVMLAHEHESVDENLRRCHEHDN